MKSFCQQGEHILSLQKPKAAQVCDFWKQLQLCNSYYLGLSQSITIFNQTIMCRLIYPHIQCDKTIHIHAKLFITDGRAVMFYMFMLWDFVKGFSHAGKRSAQFKILSFIYKSTQMCFHYHHFGEKKSTLTKLPHNIFTIKCDECMPAIVLFVYHSLDTLNTSAAHY